MVRLLLLIVCIVLLKNEKEIGVLGVLDNVTFPRIGNMFAYSANVNTVPWFSR